MNINSVTALYELTIPHEKLNISECTSYTYLWCESEEECMLKRVH